MSAAGLPLRGFWRFFPYHAPVWNRSVIVGGYALLLAGFFVLLIPPGYNLSICGLPSGCAGTENPFLPIALDCLLLATVPLVCLFDFRGGFRAGGIVAVGVVLFLILGTLLWWDSSFTFGQQTITILARSPPWSPILKLGTALAGAGLVILGCMAQPGRLEATSAPKLHAVGSRPIEGPKP